MGPALCMQPVSRSLYWQLELCRRLPKHSQKQSCNVQQASSPASQATIVLTEFEMSLGVKHATMSGAHLLLLYHWMEHDICALVSEELTQCKRRPGQCQTHVM